MSETASLGEHSALNVAPKIVFFGQMNLRQVPLWKSQGTVGSEKSWDNEICWTFQPNTFEAYLTTNHCHILLRLSQHLLTSIPCCNTDSLRSTKKILQISFSLSVLPPSRKLSQSKWILTEPKIMASSPITSWQIDGEKWKQWQILFSWTPKYYAWWLKPWN